MRTHLKELKRSDLYDQVWETPIHKLAKMYELSDVGLAKVCKRHNIPHPPRGYWARKNAGYKVKQVPLPNPDSDDIIVIYGSRIQAILKTAGFEYENQINKVKSQRSNRVPSSLRSPHPLISDALEILRSSKPDKFGYLSIDDKTCLKLNVTKKTLSRAIRIFNTLILALEKRGYQIEVTKPQKKTDYYSRGATIPSKTGVHILGSFVEFSIFELHETMKVQSNDDSNAWGYNSIQYKHIPNGRLSLKISDMYLHNGLRKTWSDGKKQLVDNCLDSFIHGLINMAEALRQKELEKEKREQERILELQCRAEERRRIEQESARIYDLNDRLDDIKLAQAIREFINMVRTSALDRDKDVSKGSQLGQWLSWAEDRARRLSKNAIETILELRKNS